MPLYKGLRAYKTRDNKAQFYPFRFILHLFSITHVRHDLSLTKFLSFIDDHHATPVQDTAQRRHRRRRAVGTRRKDSFQIKSMHKPFLLSFVDHIPRFFTITNEETGVLASAAPEELARTWTQGA